MSVCLKRMFCWPVGQDLRSPWPSLTKLDLQYAICLWLYVHISYTLIYYGKKLTTGLYKPISLLICDE
jgi:hypothetical protein